jgi:glucose/arabinose dehydrogenase
VKSRAGAGAKGGNRITLLREPTGNGEPALRTVFIDHLHSPYGIVLVGDTLYVANTDAILAFNYVPGVTQITSPGVKLADLPAGPIDHHWTKSMTASADGSKLYVGVGSNSNITENGMAVEEGRAAIYEIDRLTGAKRIFASGTRNPTGVAFEPHTHQLFAVVTGFLGTDNETVHGRPVGLALDRSGALLVADDAGDTVWRVSATRSAP